MSLAEAIGRLVAQPDPEAKHSIDGMSSGKADQVLQIVQEFDPALAQLQQLYMGPARSGQPFNFITHQPQFCPVRLPLYLPRSFPGIRQLQEGLRLRGKSLRHIWT